MHSLPTTLTGGALPRELPTKSASQTKELKALIPRKTSGEKNWQPAILDDPDAAAAIAGQIERDEMRG